MENFDTDPSERGIKVKKISLIAGPILALALLIFGDLNPEHPEITAMAAVALLMAFWWISEAIPLAATALLPIALFPILGIMPGKKAATLYFNHVIFLFLGGFIVALAMQKWNLHKRIALKLILLIGLSPQRIILGFMAATAFLSMWISNTATTMMMVPIAVAIILKMEETLTEKELHRFSLALLLGIAYSASIGGLATLIGTPPNLSFARIYSIYFPNAPEITFASWFAFALPLSIMFFFIAWTILVSVFRQSGASGKVDKNILHKEYDSLGPIGYEEKIVLTIFTSMALLWLTRKGVSIGAFTLSGWGSLLPKPKFADDGTVAIVMALLLFIIPAKGNKGARLMDWESAKDLPWGIVLLFGGGFALAGGFKESGLSTWAGSALSGLSTLNPIILIILLCLAVTFLTELTSNTATTEMILPILAGLAVAIKMNPLFLMIPATLSASCAFMLPVATPPNAIIFGTGRIKIYEMARVGILLNIIGAFIITLAIFTTGKVVFGIDPSVFPECCLISK